MRKFDFNTKWDKDILKCACLTSNPCCKSKDCEVLSLTLNPYDDLIDTMQKQNTYKKVKGAWRQR